MVYIAFESMICLMRIKKYPAGEYRFMVNVISPGKIGPLYFNQFVFFSFIYDTLFDRT